MPRLSRNARLLGTAALAAAAWALPVNHAHAAPFVTFSLVGRPYGSSDPFASTVVLPQNATAIEYQLIADMAPTGTTNVQSLGNISRTITSLTVGTDGLNTTKIDIFESAAQDIQLSFTSPGTLADPSPAANDWWGQGAGADGGTPTARPGRPGSNDLIAIRPAHAAGVFTAIDPEVIMTGILQVDDVGAGGFSLMQIRVSTTSPGGNLKINGSSTVLLNNTSENSSDPFTAYNPMTIVPEPASALLAGIAAIRLLARRRH
jgi:hypothetical protein